MKKCSTMNARLLYRENNFEGNQMNLRTAMTVLASLSLVATIGVAAPANAIERETRGNCNQGSIWFADIELEYGVWDLGFEVNTRAEEGTWRLLVKQNGRTVSNSRAEAFRDWDDNYSEVEWDLIQRDRPGNDRFFLSAKNLATGEICRTTIRS